MLYFTKIYRVCRSGFSGEGGWDAKNQEAASAAACAIGAFIGLHGKTRIKKKSIWLGSKFIGYRKIKLKYDIEDTI